MAGKRRRLIEGFRFVCSPGGKPCGLCAPHCGQEYVHEPRAGQHPMEERPDLPMHPHCRCKLELITNTLAYFDGMLTTAWDQHPNFANPHLSEAFNTGRIGPYGLTYESDGRSFMDGPADGNHGGFKWSHGRNEDKLKTMAAEEGLTLKEWKQLHPIPPVHSADERYLAHDDEYDNFEYESFFSSNKLEADQWLVDKLTNLPPDPRLWENPPITEKEIEHAEKYKEAAIVYFSGKLDYAKLRRLYGKEYMSINYPGLYRLFEKD